jgi:predicted DNA-binding transcriptional regulator AlpA
MPRAPRTIQVRNIAGPAEVDRELRHLHGGLSRMTAYRWRSSPGFPRPVKRLKGGPVWDLAEVRLWVAENKTPEEP